MTNRINQPHHLIKIHVSSTMCEPSIRCTCALQISRISPALHQRAFLYLNIVISPAWLALANCSLEGVFPETWETFSKWIHQNHNSTHSPFQICTKAFHSFQLIKPSNQVRVSSSGINASGNHKVLNQSLLPFLT